MAFIPNQLTPVSAEQLVAALARAYKRVTGSAASKAILALLVGQVALETGGTGGTLHSIHNWNLGNVRGTYNGDWTSFRAGEIDASGHEYFLEAGDPRNKFRAYPSLEASAEDYVRTLRAHPHWWDGLQTGTIQGFIRGLTTYPAYFTANKQKYASIMAERARDYESLIASHATEFGLGAALVAGVAAGFTYRALSRKRA